MKVKIVKIIDVNSPNIDELDKDEQFRFYLSLLNSIRKIKKEN